jgi:hypothetical protein
VSPDRVAASNAWSHASSQLIPGRTGSRATPVAALRRHASFRRTTVPSGPSTAMGVGSESNTAAATSSVITEQGSFRLPDQVAVERRVVPLPTRHVPLA